MLKTLERIIRKYVVNHLYMRQIFNPSQHNFRHRRSCLSQFLEHYDRVWGFIEDGDNVDSIYLDFAKAYDKFDIGILSHKLGILD